MATLSCRDCAGPISRHSKTGRCRPCALRHSNADPSFIARKRERLAAAIVTPEFKDKHSAGCARAAARRMDDPVQRARLIEIGHRYGAANLCRMVDGPVRERAALSVKRHHLAWCPEQFWPLNQKLKRNGYRLPERQQIIGAEMAKIERDRVAAMDPFERQLERVRNGARLIEVKPTRSPDPTFTLGGVATGML